MNKQYRQNMKKSILFVALAALLTVATGCDNTENSYPNNLCGYWASKPDASKAWYALNVGKDASVSVLTHYEDGIADSTEPVELTYDNQKGNGYIIGVGRQLPLQAKNDSIIVVSFAKGDVELYRGVIPEGYEESSLEGSWKAKSSDGTVSYLLVYSDKPASGVAHATFYSYESGMPFGYGAKIKTFDTKTKRGSIYASVEGEEETMEFTTDYTTLTIDDDIYTRQARVQGAAIDMAGTWKASVQGGITLTAEVQQDHSCKMVFAMPPQLAAQMEIPSTGTIYGHTYYSQYAGRGAFEMDSVDIQMDIEGDESEMENTAGFSVVFEAVSATSVQVPINAQGMKMALEFKKQ